MKFFAAKISNKQKQKSPPLVGVVKIFPRFRKKQHRSFVAAVFGVSKQKSSKMFDDSKDLEENST